MIPALGIPIYNRHDLLLRCLNSVDVPVDTVFLVNNGPQPLIDILPRLRARAPIRQFILHEDKNYGVAGAWNWIQRAAFAAGLPGVLICGNDIEWQPGDLATFAKAVADFPDADFVFGNHAYSSFYVTRRGWELIGAFDENIEIAHLEDSDHWQRIRHTPAKAMHVAGLNTKHEGSQTVRSADAAYRRVISEAHARNWQYYGQKWGCPPNSHAAEKFTTPFGRGGPVNEWKLTAERLNRPYVFAENPVGSVGRAATDASQREASYPNKP